MKLKKKKLNKDKSIFKKRFCPSTRNLKLFFGTHGLFFKKSTRFELIYLVMLRKILKRLKHKVKDKTVYHKKIWFWLRKNYIISKKSKNARMGKGKGKFLRYAVRVPKNFMIFEFYGWQDCYLKNIASSFFHKTHLILKIFSKEILKERAVSNNRNYSYSFIKKYTLL